MRKKGGSKVSGLRILYTVQVSECLHFVSKRVPNLPVWCKRVYDVFPNKKTINILLILLNPNLSY